MTAGPYIESLEAALERDEVVIEKLRVEIERLRVAMRESGRLHVETQDLMQAEIERLTAENAIDVNSREAALWSETMSLKSRNEWLEGEIVRLRAALRPFADEYDKLMQQQDSFPAWHSISTTHLRNARGTLEPKP
jgi:hypothetical protein